MMTMYHKALILVALSLFALCYGGISRAQTGEKKEIEIKDDAGKLVGTFHLTTYPNSYFPHRMKIDFDPRGGQVDCKTIVFDQSAKITFYKNNKEPVVVIPGDVWNQWSYRDDDTETDGRFIDHLFCSRKPHVVRSAAAGDTQSPATMVDYPLIEKFIADKNKVIIEYEVCAGCIAGTDSGKTYGCVEWTYTRTEGGGRGKSTPGKGLNEPSDSHKKALIKFENNHWYPAPEYTICPESLQVKACPNTVNGKKGPLVFHVNSDYKVEKAGQDVKKGRKSPDKWPINNPIGGSVTACDYILVPKDQTITLKNTDCKSGAFGRSPATEGIPFEATFVDLFTGEIETIESGLCYHDDHCGTIAMTCAGVPLAGAAPIDTDDLTTLIFYTARVDDSTDAVTFKNDPLSSHPIQAYDIAGGTGMLVEIYPGESHTFFYPDMIPECFPVQTLAIEKTDQTLQGHHEFVDVFAHNGTTEIGGFDLLIGYDASALTFAGAIEGKIFSDYDWEYFTYRIGASGNCGGPCPSGIIRLIGLAETVNGSAHPTQFTLAPGDVLATLDFLVSNDRVLECQYIPIYFFWLDCGDNVVSNVGGDTLYIDRRIYDFQGNLIWDEEDDGQFPENARIHFVGAPDSCLNPDPDKPSALRLLDFINGGVDIICADSIDVRGDINVNGVANEIADAVMFTNYFVYNLAAFGDHVEASIAASDVNADGIPLSVADLVYMIRIITGDALPYQKLSPGVHKAGVHLSVNHSAAAASVNSANDIGGGYFVLEYSGYEIGEPQLINGASNMTLKYNDEDGVLKILVYSMDGGVKVKAGTENIFFIPIKGKGSIELREVQLSDYQGNLLTVGKSDQSVLPRRFTLYQNYPNPFNAETQIIYELPKASHVKIEILNVMGQKVITLIDRAEEAGVHRVEWNGTSQSGEEVASGIYFYRLEAGDFVATKKMTLLK